MLFKGDEGTRLLGHAPKNKDIMVQKHHDVHQYFIQNHVHHSSTQRRFSITMVHCALIYRRVTWGVTSHCLEQPAAIWILPSLISQEYEAVEWGYGPAQ